MGTIVLVVAHQYLKIGDRFYEIAARPQVIQQVRAESGAGVNADPARVQRGFVTGDFEKFPGTFQKQTVLGIGNFGFARREAEKRCVKHLDIVQYRVGADVAGLA